VTERAPRRRQAMTRCPLRMRHWRIAFGTTGMRTPVCCYCGSPNPKPLSGREWGELLDWSRTASVGSYVRAAIEEHERAQAGDRD